MSGQNKHQVLGILLDDDQLYMTVACVSWAVRAMQRKAKWRSIKQNMADSPHYARMRELEAILRGHLIVREMTTRPLGVPPRGARGLGSSPGDAGGDA